VTLIVTKHLNRKKAHAKMVLKIVSDEEYLNQHKAIKQQLTLMDMWKK
jgi:hypothetical protein